MVFSLPGTGCDNINFMEFNVVEVDSKVFFRLDSYLQRVHEYFLTSNKLILAFRISFEWSFLISRVFH